jgi:hypothetical protein
MPSSGRAVRFISQAYGFRFLGDPAQHFPIGEIPAAFFLATVRSSLEALGALLSPIVPIWAGLSVITATAFWKRKRFFSDLKAFRFLFVFLAVLFSAYVLYVFGQWYFPRYFRPMALGYLILLAVCMKQLSSTRIGTGLSIGLAVLSLAWIVPITIQESSEITARTNLGNRSAMARFVNTNTPKGAVIGGFQTGIVGYYLDRRFVSLDGKTNSEALRALENGRMDEYIEAQGIDYLMDWPWLLDDLLVRRSADPGYLARQTLIAKRFYYVFKIEKTGGPERLDNHLSRAPLVE